MKCCVCRRDREEKDMQRIELTAVERALVKASQKIDVTELWYCKPCFAVLSDRVQGAQLIKGTMQVNLQARKHPHATQIAQRAYDKMIEMTAKKPAS